MSHRKPKSRSALGPMNLGQSGPVTVSHGATWARLPPRLLKDCIAHTLATNDGKFLRTHVEQGPDWQLVSFWLVAPSGERWVASFDRSKPKHFTMITAAEQAERERELEAEAAYLAGAA